MSFDKKAVKNRIDELLDEYYLDVQGVPGQRLTQEAVIKLITEAILGVVSAWWSIKELMDYVRERRNFKEMIYGQ